MPWRPHLDLFDDASTLESSHVLLGIFVAHLICMRWDDLALEATHVAWIGYFSHGLRHLSGATWFGEV
jgi:hypothetical protein